MLHVWMITCLVLLLMIPSGRSHGDGHILDLLGGVRLHKNVDFTLASDDNISRAQEKQNIISDRFSRIDGRLGIQKELAFNKAIIWEISAGHKSHEFTQHLDRSEIATSLIYRWQNTFGYQAPWYQAMIKSEMWKSKVDQRSSNVYAAQLMASARFTTQVSWVLGLEYSNRDSDGRVFDTSQNRAFLHLDYNLTRWANWLKGAALYGGYAYIDGDTFSTVQGTYCNGLTALNTYDLILESEEVEWDEAFSSDYCGTWIAYRLPAVTHTATIGWNYPINHSTALDISGLWVQVDAISDIEYERTIIQLNLLKAF